MKKKYSIIVGLMFLVIYFGGLVVNQQIKEARFNNSYERYEKIYEEIVVQINRDSFFSVITEEKVANDIVELNLMLDTMRKYKNDDVFFEFLAANRKITNLVEAKAYAENWEYLTEDQRNAIISEILMDKNTFTPKYNTK